MFCRGFYYNKTPQDPNNKANNQFYQYNGACGHRDPCKFPLKGFFPGCASYQHNGGAGNLSFFPNHPWSPGYHNCSPRKDWANVKVDWSKNTKSKTSLRPSSSKASHYFDDSSKKDSSEGSNSTSQSKHCRPGNRISHWDLYHFHRPHSAYNNQFNLERSSPHNDHFPPQGRSSNLNKDSGNKPCTCSWFSLGKNKHSFDQRSRASSTCLHPRSSSRIHHPYNSSSLDNCLKCSIASRKNNHPFHSQDRSHHRRGNEKEIKEWEDYYNELTGLDQDIERQSQALYTRSLVDHTKELAERLKEKKRQVDETREHRSSRREREHQKDKSSKRPKDRKVFETAIVTDVFPMYLE